MITIMKGIKYILPSIIGRGMGVGLLLLFVACSKDATEDIAATGDGARNANSLLQVTTRSGGANDATVSYPVQVYVFQGDECRAVQTIGDEGQTLNIALVEGTYSVYAVWGEAAAFQAFLHRRYHVSHLRLRM